MSDNALAKVQGRLETERRTAVNSLVESDEAVGPVVALGLQAAQLPDRKHTSAPVHRR